MQWNDFPKTQIDSYSGQPIPEDGFWNTTGWTPGEIKGQWVLDVVAGAGLFSETTLKAGAVVIALDYSDVVDCLFRQIKPLS